jgi:hypothetical protein
MLPGYSLSRIDAIVIGWRVGVGVGVAVGEGVEEGVGVREGSGVEDGDGVAVASSRVATAGVVLLQALINSTPKQNTIHFRKAVRRFI